MMDEMRTRKLEPTLSLIQRIFNLPHYIGMVWVEPAFDDAVSYTAGKWIAAQLNVIAVTVIRTPVPRITYPVLEPTEPSPHARVGGWVSG